MKRPITRAAGTLILAAGLLAGCGAAAESPYASAASRATAIGYPAALAAARADSSAEVGAAPFSWWRRPIDLLRRAGAAQDAAESAADRLRELGASLGGMRQPPSR